MRYIGCKRKLLPFIQNFIQTTVPFKSGQVFCDLFAGTATVGQHFKSLGYRIISTDLLYSSYIQQQVKVVLNAMPSFEKLAKAIGVSFKTNNPVQSIINHLNQLNAKEAFIYQHYSPGGTTHQELPRMYYTDENAKKIDTIRQTIEDWQNNQWINHDEFCILLYALLDAASNYANTTGAFNGYLKHWGKAKSTETLTLKPPPITPSQYNHQVYAQESLRLLSQLKRVNILYLDPPYVSTQYGSAYHLLETIAKWDSPKLYGITGLRDYKNQKSLFCQKRHAHHALEQILKKRIFSHLFLSYSNEGLLTHREIIHLLEQYGTIQIKEIDYPRYHSNRKGSLKTNRPRQVKERLYYLKPFKSSVATDFLSKPSNQSKLIEMRPKIIKNHQKPFAILAEES